MKTVKKILNLKVLFWVTYCGLLIVMLPHTAWTAYHVYRDWYTAIAFSVVFELSILAFSVGFKKQIEQSDRFRHKKVKNTWSGEFEAIETDRQLQWRKLRHMFLNTYFLGLLISGFVSGLTNFSYAVQFSDSALKTLSEYSLSISIYHFSLGLILPIISVIYSFVLADRVQAFDESDVEDKKIAELRKQLRENQKQIEDLSEELDKAKIKSQSMSKRAKLLNIALKDQNKERRLIATFNLFPKLNNSGAAIIARCNPSYVTSVKKSWNDEVPKLEV